MYKYQVIVEINTNTFRCPLAYVKTNDERTKYTKAELLAVAKRCYIREAKNALKEYGNLQLHILKIELKPFKEKDKNGILRRHVELVNERRIDVDITLSDIIDLGKKKNNSH
jgi:hypothetical protein